MIYEYQLLKKAKCSKKEQNKLIPFVVSLIDYFDKSRREGLLSLEDNLDEVKIPFLKMELKLVIDGTDTELIEKILYSRILFSGDGGCKLLKKLIVLEAVLSIQAVIILESYRINSYLY